MIEVKNNRADMVKFAATEGNQHKLVKMLASWHSSRKELHGIAPKIMVTRPDDVFNTERVLGWLPGRAQMAVQTSFNKTGLEPLNYVGAFWDVEARLFSGLCKYAKIWEALYNIYHTSAVLRLTCIASSRAKIDAADLPYFRSVNTRYSTTVFVNKKTQEITDDWETTIEWDDVEVWGYRSGYINYRKSMEA